VLVLTRFAEAGVPSTFADDAAELLTALTSRPGFRGGKLVRSTDPGGGWVLMLEWATVGDWRRAFSPFDLRLRAMEFFAHAVDEGSAYEVLVDVGADGSVLRAPSDRTGLQRGDPPGDSL